MEWKCVGSNGGWVAGSIGGEWGVAGGGATDRQYDNAGDVRAWRYYLELVVAGGGHWGGQVSVPWHTELAEFCGNLSEE